MGGGVVMNDAFIASQLRAYTKSDLNARNKGLLPSSQCWNTCNYRLDWAKYPAAWKFSLQNVDSQGGSCDAKYFNSQWTLKSTTTVSEYPIFGEKGTPPSALPSYNSCPWVGIKRVPNLSNFIQAGLGYIPNTPTNGDSDTDVWYLVIMHWKSSGTIAMPIPGCYIVYQAKGRDWQACGPNVMTLYESGASITKAPAQIKLTAAADQCSCTNATCCPGRLYPQTLGYEIFNTSCESMKFTGTLRLFSPPCWNTGPGSEWYGPNVIGEGLLGYGGLQSDCPVYFAPVNPQFDCGGVAGSPICTDALGSPQPFCCSGITLSCGPNGWKIFGQFTGCANPTQLFTFSGDPTNLAVYECNPIELEWPNCNVIQNFDCSASFWAPNGSLVSNGECIAGPSGGAGCPPVIGSNVGLNQLYIPIGDWSPYVYGNNGTPTCSVTCNPGNFGYDQYFFDVGGFRDTDRCLASSLNRVFTYPRDFMGQFGFYTGCAEAFCSPGPLISPFGCGGSGAVLTTENFWIFTPFIGDPINGPCYGGLPRCQTIGIRIFEIS